MALKATSLTPDPSSTSLPATITFVAEVVDRKAVTPVERTLELALAAGNDLVFAGGAKSVTQKEKVGASPVNVTFARKKITGTGADLSSFRVTLRDDAGNDLVFCLVGLE
jgi:hypothetical protein